MLTLYNVIRYIYKHLRDTAKRGGRKEGVISIQPAANTQSRLANNILHFSWSIPIFALSGVVCLIVVLDLLDF